MSTIIRARCHIFEPNYRIIRAQFNVEQGNSAFGEYVVINLMRERGEWADAQPYRITFDPLFPRDAKGNK